MATYDGTWAYRDRFHERFARTYFRPFGDLALSSIGVGTYLGDPTDEVDDGYRAAIAEALDAGVNVIDTAINYRCQRSERVVGEVLAESDIDRDSVFLATKGGFVPFDGQQPENPGQYVMSEYVEPGIVDRDELARGQHSIAPEYIDDQLDRSLSNLDVEIIDCYYVHNPETQLAIRSREDLYDQLESTFEVLERRAAAGDISSYGVATWEALRVETDHDRHLSLPEIVARAKSAAATVENDSSHFRAVQLPFNVFMADVFTVQSHEGESGPTSALQYAHEAELNVFTSASLMQGQLLEEFPESVEAQLGGETRAQRAINFARSAPGVTTALVGMGSADHVAENVAAGTFQPMGAETFDAVFE